jgi:hypothetical protein
LGPGRPRQHFAKINDEVPIRYDDRVAGEVSLCWTADCIPGASEELGMRGCREHALVRTPPQRLGAEVLRIVDERHDPFLVPDQPESTVGDTLVTDTRVNGVERPRRSCAVDRPG